MWSGISPECRESRLCGHSGRTATLHWLRSLPIECAPGHFVPAPGHMKAMHYWAVSNTFTLTAFLDTSTRVSETAHTIFTTGSVSSDLSETDVSRLKSVVDRTARAPQRPSSRPGET